MFWVLYFNILPINADLNIFFCKIIKESKGLSYYSIQKTLITAIKRSLFAQSDIETKLSSKIDTAIWKQLIDAEKKALVS